jgi:hypothetical protein
MSRFRITTRLKSARSPEFSLMWRRILESAVTKSSNGSSACEQVAENNGSSFSFAGCRAFDDRDRGRAHAEKIDIRIFDFDADRKALRDSDPV